MLQERFAGWERAYGYGKSVDQSLTPSALRDELRDLAKKAERLAEALDKADIKTLRALEGVSTKIIEELPNRADLQRLNAADLVGRLDPLPFAAADIETMRLAISFIAENARVKAEGIAAIMKRDGRTKPPREIKAKPALYTLIINIRSFWLETASSFTRLFDDYDQTSDMPAQIPANLPSKFTVECVRRIDPDINNPIIAKAMQECIKHYGAKQSEGEK